MTEQSSDEPTAQELAARVHAAVRAIPRGCVRSYGAIGASCDPPISGYVCGRFMARVPKDAPWWRVVAKDGSLPIRKRQPDMAQLQRDLLAEEDVIVQDGKVQPRYFSK